MSQKRRSVADEPHLVVRSSVSDHLDGQEIAEHRHDGHQLVHVLSGLMTVRTPAGAWLAPPTWAVWVPARSRHSIRFTGRSALRTLYLRPGVGGYGECRALMVTPLLRELVVRATELGMLDERVPGEAAIAAVIVGELPVDTRGVDVPGAEPADAPTSTQAGRYGDGPSAFTLPEPETPLMTKVATMLVDGATLATIANRLDLGARTLERRFSEETGMTPGRWRRQRMLLRGLERIAEGATVAAASEVAGYESPSAFVAAFRTTFGTTPGAYFQ
ncbi:MAG: helix-turn-helix transcriptional regulator [Pseudonocardia sp.]|uniref:AraC family transcriptional regulator n=1 Tax=unclassified Pseudonocardia TaxID=2619320 RepID=UPI00086D6901|nr:MULTISPECIES: helix-turn-helix transcriptional regulator [unclassified Pseudonocardia]MBN9110031.1 helix-turn-helix transcriptional regulator [Pseudonocardia sp.]ODU23600.1 MAG: hypothetical protein ABS80_14385 [Pseudonocardia sp. SCN 72-51]ODV07162.1 MAG: hypothetical protein ABT15_08805 [Pseudonocardia sp. SCN 73-27]